VAERARGPRPWMTWSSTRINFSRWHGPLAPSTRISVKVRPDPRKSAKVGNEAGRDAGTNCRRLFRGYPIANVRLI
jgi:hypothetical protein